MTEFYIINVEENNDGTVNITGKHGDQFMTLYNCYPTKYNPEHKDEIINYSTITYSFKTPDEQWRKDFGQL